MVEEGSISPIGARGMVTLEGSCTSLYRPLNHCICSVPYSDEAHEDEKKLFLDHYLGYEKTGVHQSDVPLKRLLVLVQGWFPSDVLLKLGEHGAVMRCTRHRMNINSCYKWPPSQVVRNLMSLWEQGVVLWVER